MNLIFYEEAANILDASIDTLRQAVSRGELTKAGTQGNRLQLIKEQVSLFAGINPRTGHKKRISYKSLPVEQQRLWKQYASEASTLVVEISPDIDRLISEKVKEMLARQEYAKIEERKREIEKEGERFLQVNPFLQMAV